MRVKYTRHASLRLQVRGIGNDEVEHVLQKPQGIYYDVVTRAMVAVGPRLRRPGHWLFVAYVREDDVYRVVTVIDTKNPNRLANRREERGRWVRVW